MSSEETDTKSNGSSFSDVGSLIDEFDTVDLDSQNSDGDVTNDEIDDEMDSPAWNEIEPESDAEFLEDHGLIEDVQGRK